ncbi:50S ribosomal protein L10 [Candidatus Bathyarchaeota archaeon]|nr:50S ribosomal protein L10 [Candidatus Bathyarchaeota archaeon]
MSQVSKVKTEIVESTVDLLNKYHIIAAADLNKVQSGMLMDMRKSLRGQLEIKAIKNTLMRISMEKANKEGVEQWIKTIEGPNLFLFTNGDPFRLAMTLEKSKAQVFAKAGDKALTDIYIPSGNTGISPGPMIAKFGTLGIKTRIESGNIWVQQDTLVANEGEIINSDLADLLQRLNIKAAYMGLSLKAVYEKGSIIQGSDLLIDISSYATKLKEAYSNALQLAIKSVYVTPETAPSIISYVFGNAKKVAIEAGYVTKETVSELIAKANAQASSLKTKIEDKS